MLHHNFLKFFGKSVFIVLIFYIIYLKIDTKNVIYYLENSNLLWLVGALFFLLLSTIASSYRLKFYLLTIHIYISSYFAFALSLVGLLYNNIFPGSISGDGYKIYLLSKWENVKKLKMLFIILSDRLNGLFILNIFMIFMLSNNQTISNIKNFSYLLSGFFLISIIGYFLIANSLLSETVLQSFKAFLYSILVQLFCILSALCVLYGLDSQVKMVDSYIIVYLISCILSVIPISIGGAGLRELTFIYGAEYLNLDKNFGVASALVNYIINLILSTFGIVFFSKLEKIYFNFKKTLI